MEDHKENIEEEIKTVEQLCDKMEELIRQPNSEEIKMEEIQKTENVKTAFKSPVKSTYKKKGKNLSMDMNVYSSAKTIEKNSPLLPKSPNIKSNKNNMSIDFNLKLKSNKEEKIKIKIINKNEKASDNKINFSTNISNKPSANLDEILNKLKDYDEDRKTKMEKLKEKKETEMKVIYKKVPEINEKSKKIVPDTEDFFTRMQRLKEISEQKKKELIEKEELRKSELEKKQMEESSKKSKNKKDQNQIQEKVKTLNNWEHERKEKISKLVVEKDKKVDDFCTFKPEINKKSAKIASAKKVSSFGGDPIDRLYNQEILKRKQKKELMQDIYSPSFTPGMYKTNKNINLTTEFNITDRMRMNTQTNFNHVTEYTSNKDTKIEEMLRDHMKMLRNKNSEN